MRPRLRSLGIALALAGSTAYVWAQAPSSRPERAPRPRPSAMPSGRPPPSSWSLPSALPSAWPVPSGRAGRTLSELADAVRRGAVRPEEVRAKLGELASTRKARREARLAELNARYSASTLEAPAFREELRVHARRMAFLHRAQMVATTDLAEPKRSQTLTRIHALTAKEERRHGARLEALRNTPAVAAASATAVTSSTGTAAGIVAPKASAP